MATPSAQLQRATIRAAHRQTPSYLHTLAAGVMGALLLALAGCGAPATTADCDELLNQHQWQKVLNSCKKPSDRASAYLGLAGFDLVKLLNSSSSNVVPILGLTPSNITQVRQYLELAVQAVTPPDGPSSAFALLLAGFLGMGTMTEEYLDPDLDGAISLAEVNGAVGATAQIPVVTTAKPASDYFAVVVNGKPYLLDCTADAINPICTHTTTKVYDDPDGSGRLTTAIASGSESADKSTVLANLGSATSVGYPLEVFVVQMPISFSVSGTADLPSFLGVSAGSGRFKVGLSQYLSGIAAANQVLLASGGQPGGSTVTTDINSLETNFDNGATCVSTTLRTPLNALYTMYAASAGTAAQPVPSGSGSSYFMSKNLVSTSVQTNINGVIFGAAAIQQAPTGTNYGFPGGSVTQYKLLFSTVAPGAFNANTATPRVDQSYSGFPAQYENILVFGPNTAGDGRVTFMELTCVH